MKKFRAILLCTLILVIGLSGSGCSQPKSSDQIVATTLPVYDFTSRLCEGTDLKVSQLVNEPVSCLHNYTLQVSQMRTVESAELLVISGAGFEGFLHDVITSKEEIIDSSTGITLICSSNEHGHAHGHKHDYHETAYDPHIWLSPVNAQTMVNNIADGLLTKYPQYREKISLNRQNLIHKLEELNEYGIKQLSSLSCRDLITFHDGFHYLADSFDLHIVKAIEEEPGSETSAAELKELITFVCSHDLPAIFTEANGSDASARVISAETGCAVHSLDMIMYGTDYFEAMYHNIDTLKEALG